MKKLLLLVLVLSVLTAFFTSCDMLPESLQGTIDSVLEKIPGMGTSDETPDDNTGETPDENPDETPDETPNETPDETPDEKPDETPDENPDDNPDDPGDKVEPHEHEFVQVEEILPTCTENGKVVLACQCGEKTETVVESPGHDYVLISQKEPTCIDKGYSKYQCSACDATYSKSAYPNGVHVYDETVEASRFVTCQNCGMSKFRKYNDGKYKEILVYTLVEEDVEEFYSLYDEMEAILAAADAYDPALHAYSAEGELAELYTAMEQKYEEMYEILEYVSGQMQMAQIEYHMDMANEEKLNNYNYASEIRTQLVADFYSFSAPIYDSMYREFYYYGMTEQEILEFLFDSNAVGNDEYKALVDRNNAIELEYDAINHPELDDKVLELYAEFVANNNRIAEIMGYNNYLEYAYENIYDRGYSYSDVAVIREYVKEYIVPLYTVAEYGWVNPAVPGLTQSDLESFYSQVMYSFFSSYEGNKYLNDYIDLLTFDESAAKQLSFSDELNNLVTDGNLFRGEYEGAYVTNLYGFNTPIAYFGPDYDNPFTVCHEFGHYMNEKYNENAYSQSFDLLEMHSQGNEILYLSFLSDNLGGNPFILCEKYNMFVMLNTVMNALIVDTFEQAVYTNSYDGYNSDTIMADGAITADEYDLLYSSIIVDFGVGDCVYIDATYWRYVTIHAPCYYVSYSVSAISVLQLYPMAKGDFDAAKEAYLKLFTYTDTYEDEYAYMTVEEVLEYAGLYSYMDEALYEELYEYLYPRLLK